MRKKPEYGLGRNSVAIKPVAHWPLAAEFITIEKDLPGF